MIRDLHAFQAARSDEVCAASARKTCATPYEVRAAKRCSLLRARRGERKPAGRRAPGLGYLTPDDVLVREAPATGERRPCLGGCGRDVLGWVYCDACRSTLARGAAIDWRDLPTYAEREHTAKVCRRFLRPRWTRLPRGLPGDEP